MKKLFIGLLSFFLLTGTMFAQDAKKSLKEATRALGSYNLDPGGNKDKLKEAKDAIDAALSTDEGKATVKAWLVKGEIYNEIATQMVAQKQLNLPDEGELPVADNPAGAAAAAFMMALDKAEKKYETKDALAGLQTAQSNLSNLGIYKYEEQNYVTAFDNFKSVIDIHDVLAKNGEKSSLDVEDDYNNQLYITGLAALQTDKVMEAKPFFTKLYEMKYDKPAIYEALYKIASQESDAMSAYKYLDDGRKQYPDDISLLFADINHHLKNDQLDVLITKLEQAIEKEPNNVSLYTTTGNVYDNLYQRAKEAGDEEKSEKYFNKALDYYKMALEKKEKDLTAIYSIGALYFNRAAAMTKEMNELGVSKEELKRYDELSAKVAVQFEAALPYFKQAEQLDPNDTNTLIALKEIFARKDDLETSNVFKDRLEKVQSGGTNDASYFK